MQRGKSILSSGIALLLVVIVTISITLGSIIFKPIFWVKKRISGKPKKD